MNYTEEQIKEINQLIILASRSSIGLIPSEEEFDNIPKPFKETFCRATTAAFKTRVFQQMSEEEKQAELLRILLKNCNINPFTGC